MLQSLSTRTECQKHIICQEKSQRNARLEKVLGSTMSVIFLFVSRIKIPLVLIASYWRNVLSSLEVPDRTKVDKNWNLT